MEYTGHGARDTDGVPSPPGANGTPGGDTDVARSAPTAEHGAEYSGALVPTTTEHQQNTTEHTPEHLRAGAFRRWRNARRLAAERTAGERNAAQAERNAQRDVDRRNREQARNDARMVAVRSRRNMRNGTERQSDDSLAPVPTWMRIFGVWIHRVFGSLPLVAPLVVSGYFTCKVFVDEPLNAHLAVALIVTLALEGGLYKLVTLESRTLLEGDSTIAIRVWIGIWITMIGSLIFAHAVILEATKQGLNFDTIDQVNLGWSWIPAAGSAAFSVLGVAIYRREARFQHRVALRAKGRVDKQAPKFSLLSWLLLPWETFWAFRHAIRFRLDRPLDAINDYRYWKAAGKPKLWPDPAELITAGELDPAELIRRVEVASPVLARTLAIRYADVLHDAATDGTLSEFLAPATLARMERDLNGTGRNGTRSLGPAPVSAPPALPAGTAGRDTGRNSERYAERNGTRNGTPDGAEQHTVDNGTAPETGDGTRNGTERSGTDGTIPHLSHVLDVTAKFSGWQLQVPSVRGIRDAVDTAVKARGNPAGFSSMSISSDVRKFLMKVQGDAEFARTLEAARASANRTK
jgi:hypothetical protein